MMAFLSGYQDFWDNGHILILKQELTVNHTFFFFFLTSWENSLMYLQFVQFINYDMCTYKDKII